MLQAATTVVSLANRQARTAFASFNKLKDQPTDVECIDAANEDVSQLFLTVTSVFRRLVYQGSHFLSFGNRRNLKLNWRA